MNSVVLGTGAYTLLLSSIITLVILLTKRFKQLLNTSFYILSTSDVLCSVLTAIILFRNYIEKIHNTNSNEQNNSFFSNDIFWNQEVEDMSSYEGNLKNSAGLHTINESNFNASSPCFGSSIIMQYAMFFVPLTNTFVSLLTFSIQCNLYVLCLRNRCAKFLQLHEYKKDNHKSNENMINLECYDNKKFNIQIADSNLEASATDLRSNGNLGTRNIMSITRNIENLKIKLAQCFTFKKVEKDNKKVLGVFVLSQWIIPILVTGVLYFAEYNSINYFNPANGAECFFESNFLFDNCYTGNRTTNIAKNVTSDIYIISSQNYINNEEIDNLSDSNDTQVHQIISKIQNIVHSVLNDTSDINSTKSAASYLLLNHDHNITISKYNLTRETTMAENENTYDLFTSKENGSIGIQLGNNTNEYNTESLLFNELVNSEEKASVEKNIHITKIPHFHDPDEKYTESLNKSESMTETFGAATTAHNKFDISDDQIYVEILKRIHGTTAQNVLKDRYKNNWYYNMKQPKQYKNKQETLWNNSNFLKNIHSTVDSDKRIDLENLRLMSACMSNECIISTKFLKMHIFILLFVIYFLPILLSSVLQVRGKLMCRVILHKLETISKISSNNPNINNKERAIEMNFNDSTDSEVICSTSTWFSKYNKENFNEELNKDSESLQHISVYEKHFNKEPSKQSTSSVNASDENQEYTAIANQAGNIHELFKMIRMSMICGILLWTPVFLKVLLKIFLCMETSTWLLNATYFSAIAFGTLRNIFNLKMIKLQVTETSSTKINSVSPIN